MQGNGQAKAQSWYFPPWGSEKYPGWVIDSPEPGKRVEASDISPNLLCVVPTKKKKGSDSSKTVGRLLLRFF